MKAITFIRKHLQSGNKRLDDGLLQDINAIKLPFTSRNYYAFCDKYLPENVNEDLFLDENEKYFREIATDYDTLKYLYYFQRFYTDPVFCDIGCGIGNVVHYTGRMGYSSFGYDINTFLKPVHGRIKADVVYADILKDDLARLATVDVLYIYRPINDKHMMNRLFRLIHQNTKRELVVFYNYPHSKSVKGYDTIELGQYDNMVLLLKQPIV